MVGIHRESIRSVKKKVVELLKMPEVEQTLKELAKLPASQVINSLFSLLYNEDPILKWHTVTAMGSVVSDIADEDMETSRVVMRRLMWNMNDESGGIGWGSPEAMGEILAVNNSLAAEYSQILLSYVREDGNFQEHPFMQRGVLWGIGRLSSEKPNYLKETAPLYIIPFLNSPDAFVRGFAAWISGLLNVEEARPELERLSGDENPIQIYNDRELRECLVKDLAFEALSRFESV